MDEPRLVKTRKKTICFWCGEKITIGESVLQVEGIALRNNYRDTRRLTRYLHRECKTAMLEVEGFVSCDTFGIGRYFRGSTEKRVHDEVEDEFETDEFFD